MVRAFLDSSRWQRVHPGVYATFTGPLPTMSRLWAAILYSGRDAVVAGASALWLAGALDGPPQPIRRSPSASAFPMAGRWSRSPAS